MKSLPGRSLGLAFCLLVAAAPAVSAVEISPHRALYRLTLDSARSSSGVVGASGAMYYEWGETCDGWTVEQRFRLRLFYAEQDNVDMSSTLVTWESKDGQRYRFNERRLRNGELDEEIRGEAQLKGAQIRAVYFDGNSATLNDAARAAIRDTAATAKQKHVTRVTISGSGEAAGAPGSSQSLSQRRARAVMAELVRNGVPARQITIGAGSATAAPANGGRKDARDRRIEITLETPEGGTAEFTKPEAVTLPLAPGVLFPTAHTLLLIERAQANDKFVSRFVFDGATLDNAGQITAVIGPQLRPDQASNPNRADLADQGKDRPGEGLLKNPLLQRPSWRIRLAFFPADSKSEQPDYELGMRLLDNGVSQDMSLDYSDYVIRATLDDIEALPKPSC